MASDPFDVKLRRQQVDLILGEPSLYPPAFRAILPRLLELSDLRVTQEQVIGVRSQRVTPTQFAVLQPGSTEMEVLIEADAANGIFWPVRYLASFSGASKWISLGGPPLEAQVLTSESTSSLTFTDLATVGPSITVPVTGVYDIVYSTEIYKSSTNAATGGRVAPKLGAAAADANDGRLLYTDDTVRFQSGVGRRVHRKSLTANDVVKLQYLAETAVATYFVRRELALFPVRLGA